MGGRQGQSSSEILGKGKGRSRGRGSTTASLSEKLEKGSSKAVAVATFAVIASFVPAVGIMYAAYQVADYTYPIAKEGILEYQRTKGDSDKAVEKMKQETFRQTGRLVSDKTIEAVTGAAVHGAIESRGVEVNQAATTFIETAVSETIEELID